MTSTDLESPSKPDLDGFGKIDLLTDSINASINASRLESIEEDEPNELDTLQLHKALYEAMLSKGGDVDALILERLQASTGAIAASLAKVNSSEFLSKTQGVIEPALGSSIRELCEVVLVKRTPQVTTHKASQKTIVCTPLQSESGTTSIVLVLGTNRSLPEALEKAHLSAVYMRMACHFLGADYSTRIAQQMTNIFDVISLAQGTDSVQEAGDLVVEELKSLTDCKFVALVTLRRGQPKVVSWTGTSNVDNKSEFHSAIADTCHEAGLHEHSTLYPPGLGDAQHALVAHEHLASQLGCESVGATPIRLEEECIGFLVWGSKKDSKRASTRVFLSAIALPLARTLRLLRQSELGWMRRATNLIGYTLKTRVGVLSILVILALLGSMMIQQPFYVRSKCVLDSISHRYAVAPYDGIVERGFVRPGDVVEQGNRLAKMDDKEVNWELASIRADLEKSEKERSIALAEDDVSAALLAELEAKRLDSQRQLFEYRQRNLEIVSPVSGVIISGDLELAEHAAVRKGDTLYEVGALSPLKLQVHVSDQDVMEVKPGQSVTIWLDGVPGKPLELEIERILPRSETQEGRNVFVVEAILPNENEILRPGMRGIARIKCDPHALGWNLFHKPWEYLVSRFQLFRIW